MKIVAISDTHTKWSNLIIPKCDILISAGDYSFRGEPKIVGSFHTWLNQQDAKHIISVQGNHEVGVENYFQYSKELALKCCPRVHFMDEGLVKLEGLKIWCSAITPFLFNWAWNVERGNNIKRHWDFIPDDIDILITHGPPMGILDEVYEDPSTAPRHAGCQDLLNRIKELKNLKHHFFGHIHSGYGHKKIDGVNFWNCSICNESYRPVNGITVVDL